MLGIVPGGNPGGHVESRRMRRGRLLPHPLPGGCGLRALTGADAPELYAVIDANREHLARWMPWARGQTLQGVTHFIRTAQRQAAEDDGAQAGITCNGDLIGVIGVHAIQWAHRTTTIGYWMAERSQGRGTMTEACRVLTDHAFAEWRVNRVEIRAATDNVRSRAIPERLGFKQEGTLRQVERVEGRYLDHAVYGMLAAEWRRL